jgi:hypothetical protein
VAGGRHLRDAPAGGTACARGWHADPRWAVACAGAFLGLAMLLDAGSGGLTAPRAGCWVGLSLGLLAVLLPSRVVAGDGWLTVRSPVRTRSVRTDALAGVCRTGDVAVRLVLRDVHGGRVELDPRILVASPLLWHLLDAGVRRSRERGTLRYGARVLGELGERVDGEAESILRASGLR